MPRNPLLGIENEEEKKEAASADQSDVEETDGEEGADDESEDEGSEDASDEDGESEEDSEEEEGEDEEEEVKPTKNARASRVSRALAPAPAKKKKAVKSPGTGTLGDARIDSSVPLSANARTYWSALLESPLVPSIIPPDILNEDTEHVFCINSLRVIVPKGRIVQVPLMLAQEIAQSFKNRV